VDQDQVDQYYQEDQLPNINKEDLSEYVFTGLEEDVSFLQNTNLPIGDIIFPTPIPGIWINLNLGFEIERPEDLDG
jgi:hypothetical protein